MVILPDTQIHACNCVCCMCVSTDVHVHFRLLCLWHVCISMDGSAVDFSGVTENDLKMLLLENVPDSEINPDVCVYIPLCGP